MGQGNAPNGTEAGKPQTLADITAQMQALMAQAVEAGASAEDFSGIKSAVDKTVEVTVEKEREAPRQYFADVLRKAAEDKPDYAFKVFGAGAKSLNLLAYADSRDEEAKTVVLAFDWPTHKWAGKKNGSSGNGAPKTFGGNRTAIRPATLAEIEEKLSISLAGEVDPNWDKAGNSGTGRMTADGLLWSSIRKLALTCGATKDDQHPDTWLRNLAKGEVVNGIKLQSLLDDLADEPFQKAAMEAFTGGAWEAFTTPDSEEKESEDSDSEPTDDAGDEDAS